MIVSGMNTITKNPAVLIACGLYRIGKYIFMFSFTKPSAFRVRSTCFYMGSIHKNFRRIYQLKFVAFRKDMGEYLFKQVRVLEASCVVLSKGRKMRRLVQHIQSEEPTVATFTSISFTV